MPKIQSNYLHVLVTRYNVGLYSPHTGLVDAEQWMAHRLPIFENYCLPSILGQSCQDFIWLLCLDERTPHRLIDQIVSLLPEHITPLMIGPGRSYARIKDAILKLVPNTVRFIVTQQHDNDDFLATDYIENVHRALWDSRDLPYLMDTELIYIVKEENMKMHISNIADRIGVNYATPFCVVVEDRQSAMTCMHIGHAKLRQFIPRFFLISGLCSGRVVHELNLSPKDRDSGQVVTEDMIETLSCKFGVNTDRIMGLWRSSQL